MPFKSEKQRRLFYAKARRGEISDEKVKEWQDETPKGKKLPMYAKKTAEVVPITESDMESDEATAIFQAWANGDIDVSQVGEKLHEARQSTTKTASFLAGVTDAMLKAARSNPNYVTEEGEGTVKEGAEGKCGDGTCGSEASCGAKKKSKKKAKTDSKAIATRP